MGRGAAGGAGAELDRDFERFVRRCSRSLFRTALLLSADHSEAEDLLQLAFLRTCRRWESARDSPEAYARRVLVNLSHDSHRQAHRRVREEPLDRADLLAASSDAVDAVPRRNAVVIALRQLPSRQREVVVLRFYLDLSIAQTADAIGASEGTVKSYTARAITRLRTLLGDVSPTIVADRAEVPHDD